MENINIFGYLETWGGGGGRGFNNQTGPILVHIYPLFYINLHVKYRSNMMKTFWVLRYKKNHVGPLHKLQGHRNVSKCSPHHIGDICTTRGNNLKTSFSYMSQNVKKGIFWGYLGGPGGVFNDQTGRISCFPAILSPISLYMSNKETIW